MKVSSCCECGDWHPHSRLVVVRVIDGVHMEVALVNGHYLWMVRCGNREWHGDPVMTEENGRDRAERLLSALTEFNRRVGDIGAVERSG